ncbi:MAG: hypothetical protein P3W96_006645 [Halomonas sp.]|jgi:type II secretory pathway pseudopilin PulG|nr:hypothetical protein [Halomonas sp.]MDM7481682.1 hypothetical protein [Halomonas sp.]
MHNSVSSDGVISLPQALANYKMILSAAQRLSSSVNKAERKRAEEARARELASRLRDESKAAYKALADGDFSGQLRIEKTIQRDLQKVNNEVDRAIEGANKEAEKSEQAYADLLSVLRGV